MSSDELIDVLCPSPDEWKKMEAHEFQFRVGKCLHYLLGRDRYRLYIASLSSFVGGVIGGIVAYVGMRGF
jgi:hypothetical protein